MIKGIFGSKKVIGLEINDYEIKAAELREKRGNIDLVNIGKSLLPAGLVFEGIVKDHEAVGATLVNMWREFGFKSNDVVLGLANQNVIVRFASFPGVEKSKLHNMIKYQANEYMPFDINDNSVIFDYSVIGEKIDEETKMWDVLMVAGKREMINGFINAVDYAGLNPLEIEVLPLSLLKLIDLQNAEKVIAITNISYGISNLLIAEKGNPRLARMMPTPYEESDTDTDTDNDNEESNEENDEENENNDNYNDDNNETLETVETVEPGAEGNLIGANEVAAVEDEDLNVEIIEEPEDFSKITEDTEDTEGTEIVDDANMDANLESDQEIVQFLAEEEKSDLGEKLQKSDSIDSADSVEMDDWKKNLVNNIRVSVDFYQSKEKGLKSVEKVLLCGHKTDDINLKYSIKNRLDVGVEVIDPFYVLNIENKVIKDFNPGEYSLCLSLGYEGLEV